MNTWYWSPAAAGFRHVEAKVRSPRAVRIARRVAIVIAFVVFGR